MVGLIVSKEPPVEADGDGRLGLHAALSRCSAEEKEKIDWLSLFRASPLLPLAGKSWLRYIVLRSTGEESEGYAPFSCQIFLSNPTLEA